jgi:DNA polymerase-1
MPIARLADRIMLVDGHSVAYRAYHALPASLSDATGAPANALYGFMNILFRVLQDHRPTHLIVTLDRGRPFRADLFAEYKASRATSPADFEPQIVKLRALLEALCIPVLDAEGFEADDLLATLSHQARGLGLEVAILSGDLDVLQLVGDGLKVIAPGKTFSEPVVYDAARVQERYGIAPSQLADWKALVGDTSDEIPGVAGIGKKTATELLQQHGTLSGLYAHLDSVTNARARNALAQGRDKATLSRELVSLREDAPVRLDLDLARLGRFDREKAVFAVLALGFRTLADRIPKF